MGLKNSGGGSDLAAGDVIDERGSIDGVKLDLLSL
jgi:hypothetical protein